MANPPRSFREFVRRQAEASAAANAALLARLIAIRDRPTHTGLGDILRATLKPKHAKE